MSVGSRIKELREERKLSRNELANLIGVTVGAISNYENEVSSPKESILFKIIEALHCDANYLFQDAIKMSSINNDVSISEYALIKKYRLLDTHGKEMVDFTLNKEYERSIDLKMAETKITKFPAADELTVQAAHNDKADDPEEQEKISHDLSGLKRPEK